MIKNFINEIPEGNSTVTIPLKEYEKLVRRANENENTRQIVHEGSDISFRRRSCIIQVKK